MRRAGPFRAAAMLLLAALLTLRLDASGTLGGFTVGTVSNPTDSARAARLSITNSVGNCTGTTTTSPVSCANSVYPARSNATGSATSRANTITNSGDFPASALAAKYRVATCGAVQLANARTGTVTGSGGTGNATGSSGAMLPRFGTTFSPTGGPMASSGFITFDGTGYAASVGSTTEPTSAFLNGGVYGLGIWFRTTDTGTDPLFGFGSSGYNVAGSNDRILYLKGGKISFVAGPGSATTPATASGVPTYSDGSWHYAYVAFGRGLLGLAGITASVFVDGATVVSNASISMSQYSGYWHLGWSPINAAAAYFTGSLSGFAVDDSGNAPSTSTAKPTSYTSFDPTATQLWQLDDSGGTFDGTTTSGTYTGTVFPQGSDPCTYVDISWTVTNPTQIVTAVNATLRTQTTAGYVTGTAPAVGTPQTSTITLSRDAGYNPYASGLILYAPVQTVYTLTGTPTWTVSFSWSAAATAADTGSTVVIS